MSFPRPVRALALAAASALLTGFAFVVPATTAQAAPSLKVKSVKVKGPKSVNAVTKATDISFTVKFKGPKPSSKIAYDCAAAPTVEVLKSLAATPVAPVVSAVPATVAPKKAGTYKVRVTPETTAGKYRVKVPICVRNVATGKQKVKLATYDFTVRVSAATAVDDIATGTTLLDGYGRGKKWNWAVTGPDYLQGAKVTVYVQAPGKSKWKKVTSTKLNKHGDKKFKSKKVRVSIGSNVYFKFSASAYGPSFKSPTYPIVER
ncbi:MAG: hypothetical protein LCH76_11335 [Actinobacteria bacterium]|nr:hypothetical protein [Actinomycetota bacterium]